jgi:hypothetical protein
MCGPVALLLAIVLLLLAPALAGAQPGEIRLRPVSIVDQALGFEAYRMLVPVDWQVEGGIIWWVPVNCAYPAALRLRAFNPRGAEEVNVFPARPFSWSPQGIAFFPPGSYYLGNEVRPPVDATGYVRQYLIPRFRPQLAQARLTGVQPLPELSQAAAAALAGLSPKSSAARVSFEYEQAGRTVQEDVYVAIVMIPVVQSIVGWGPYTLVSVTAEKSQLADRSRLFTTMVTSLSPTFRWYNRYLQLSELCTRSAMEASNQAVLRSKIISQTNDQISAGRRQAYENRQAAQDRVNAKWSQYIRGTDSYQNPFEGRRVDLPSGYSHVWTNRLGEYVLSNNATYNPNVGSNIQWQQMKK